MFSRLVRGSAGRGVPNGGHATENDNPETLLRIVRDFRRRLERAR
jgi:hypothetical protein